MFAIFSPCRQAAAFLARQQDRSAAILRCAAGQRLRVGRCGAQRSPSRPRWSRAWKQQQEITMAQIGTFTRAEDGSYTGTIKTL
ncbi:MAG TPA: hypothetical protein DEA80_08560, partial [Afipia sp.]|nr:hypothetical protein [Afipia sp.]